MKKYLKISLLVAAVLVVAGAAVCGVALDMVDFDFRRLSTDYGSAALEHAQYDPASVAAIVVDIDVDDLRVEPSADGQIHVRYAQREHRPYRLSLTGGVLRLEQTQSGWQLFQMSFGWEETAAVLSVPADFAGDLTLHSDVGDIRGETLRLAGRLEAETNTGSIELSDLAAASARLTVDTGDIRCRGWQLAGDLEAEVDTGAILLEDCAADAVTCGSDTGAMRLTRLAAARVDLESNTGDVELAALAAPQIAIVSDTGSVQGTIDGAEADYTIDAEADIGDCNLRARAGRTDRRLTVRTDVGDIDLSFTRP